MDCPYILFTSVLNNARFKISITIDRNYSESGDSKVLDIKWLVIKPFRIGDEKESLEAFVIDKNESYAKKYIDFEYDYNDFLQNVRNALNSDVLDQTPVYISYKTFNEHTGNIFSTFNSVKDAHERSLDVLKIWEKKKTFY